MENREMKKASGGELKKRILKECAVDWEDQRFLDVDNFMNSPTVTYREMLGIIIEEAKRDFPKIAEIMEAFQMVDGLFPNSNGFSKRYVIDKLLKTADAIEKWFGGEEAEEEEE